MLPCRGHTLPLAFLHLVFYLCRNLDLTTVFFCSNHCLHCGITLFDALYCTACLVLLHNLHVLFAFADLPLYGPLGPLVVLQLKNFFGSNCYLCCLWQSHLCRHRRNSGANTTAHHCSNCYCCKALFGSFFHSFLPRSGLSRHLHTH